VKPQPSVLGATLYSDGERYFIVPDGVEVPAGPLWTTSVAGEERAMDEAAALAYEVDEPAADAFIAREVEQVTGKVVPALARFLLEAAASPPEEVALVLRGLMETMAAASRGDAASLERFRQRCARVSAELQPQDPALAEAVRALPERLLRLVGR
jgi:hypothetical protein